MSLLSCSPSARFGGLINSSGVGWAVAPHIGASKPKVYIMTIRFEHYRNGRNLHSHEIPAHVPTGKNEVSCYRLGDEGDESDLFRIDMLLSMSHPVSHTFLMKPFSISYARPWLVQ